MNTGEVMEHVVVQMKKQNKNPTNKVLEYFFEYSADMNLKPREIAKILNLKFQQNNK